VRPFLASWPRPVWWWNSEQAFLKNRVLGGGGVD